MDSKAEIRKAAAAGRQLALVDEATSDTYKAAMGHALWQAGIAGDEFSSRRWMLVAHTLEQMAAKYLGSSEATAQFASRVDAWAHGDEELNTDMPIEPAHEAATREEPGSDGQ